MIIELTSGWDGKTISRAEVANEKWACDWIKENAPTKTDVMNAWSLSTLDGGRKTIIDYGSHIYFGRLMKEGETK